MAEELRQEDLINYANPLLFGIATEANQLVSTACLACLQLQVARGYPIPNLAEPLNLIATVDEVPEPKRELPLSCADGQDMVAVEQCERWKAGPDTPVTEICRRFIAQPARRR